MTATWAALRDLLVVRYDDLDLRLRRRLGSSDLARETLHETYVRLNRTGDIIGVQRPDAYLYRIALNIAVVLRRSEDRQASPVEIEAAINLADEMAQTDRMAEGRFEIAALERAIEALPPRQRAVFLAARLDETPILDIAASLGISSRLVESELRKALDHCAAQLQRPSTRRIRKATSKASSAGRTGDDRF
jgi:RNA polymerase sigma-70 factor (ECF subfamily)